ncbi:MAG: aminotransferase class I/II-fold pyridoxal phosphate-dependent enzyme [Lachnospiraceae bacterium]|nr:aminotransferase class I/II-fold pyridoxal phosphate-dependent enzyme [Lachnospiraceae bacterium]
MDFNFSDRLESFGEGIFLKLDGLKKEKEKQGEKIYNLSVGTPDFKPSKEAMEAIIEAAKKEENYKYALTELPELLEAVAKRYDVRYGAKIVTEEITSVYGSQEGITHIALALCNPGDIVLVPNPGYPIFGIGPALMGAEVVTYPLTKENNFLPKLSEIDEDIAKKAKFMIVSYPANPVCVTAPVSFYKELIDFAKKYQIIIVHDNAYSDIVYDGKKGISFLAIEGAKEVGVEFYSLSKSYNLTGARISFLVGNEKIVKAFKIIRSQIDYGTFLPVQYGAIAALQEDDTIIEAQCLEYQKRRDALCGGFRKIGWDVENSQGSMFVWAKIPDHYNSSEKFVMDMVEKAGVICTPGSSFGSLGEGYVRFALVLPVEEMEKVVEAVRVSGILS